jgi:hypothetical protein
MSSGSIKRTKISYPFSSKNPGKQIPSRFPNGVHMERNTSTVHFYLSRNISLFIFPSESSVREPPPCSITGSPWTVTLRHQSHWSTFHLYFHSCTFVCRSPQKGALLHTYGENHKVTVYGDLHRRKAYVQWGAAWFPKGIVTTLHCYLYPSAMQPSARYLPPWLA